LKVAPEAFTECRRHAFYMPSPIGASVKAVIDMKKEGKWYVATDLATHVADQGRTPEEAMKNLLKGLREHYELLLELGPRRRGTRIVEVEV
jgi:predicted RNase H-like HicB family nuclease